jgi:hypothetical protein
MPQLSITPAVFVLTPKGPLERLVNVNGPLLKANVLIATDAFGGSGVASVNDPVKLHSGGHAIAPSAYCAPV